MKFNENEVAGGCVLVDLEKIYGPDITYYELKHIVVGLQKLIAF